MKASPNYVALFIGYALLHSGGLDVNYDVTTHSLLRLSSGIEPAMDPRYPR
jgi:hypothetical protein